MKKYKPDESASPSTPKTEIFVFTPEILAKLGINIQNALVTNSGTESAQNPVHNGPKLLHNEDDNDNNEDDNDNNEGSSIIETASLMKQSVFLSPTFNTTSTASEETPIYENEDTDVQNGPNSIDYAEYSDSFNAHTEEIISSVLHVNSLEHVESQTGEQENSKNYKSMKEYPIKNDDGEKLLFKHVSHEITSDTASGESERSEIISTNLEISNNCNSILNRTIKTSDINCEENVNLENNVEMENGIDDQSQGKTISNLSSIQSVLSPKKHITEEVSNQSKIASINQYKDQVSQNSSTTSTDNIKARLIAETCAKDKEANLISPNSGLKNIAVLDNRNYNNNKSIHEQNNAEIPRDSHSEFNNSSTLVDSNNKCLKLSPQKDEEMSKLSTLSNMLHKISKTYQKKSIEKPIPPSIEISQNKYFDTFQLSHDTKKNTQTITTGSSICFCLCYDFGKLAYYDCEMLYEHIHFWHNKNAGCDPEIMYSMYNNDSCAVNESREHVELKYNYDDHDNISDVDKISLDHICWNKLAADEVDLPVTCMEGVENKKNNTLKRTSERPHQTNSPVLKNKNCRDLENLRKQVTQRIENNTSSDQSRVTRGTSEVYLTNSVAHLATRRDECKPAKLETKSGKDDPPSSVRRSSKKDDVSISNKQVSSEKNDITCVVSKEKPLPEENVNNLRPRRSINTQKDDKNLDTKHKILDLTDTLPLTSQNPSSGKVPKTEKTNKKHNDDNESSSFIRVSPRKTSDQNNISMFPKEHTGTESVPSSKLEKNNEKIPKSSKSTKRSDMPSDSLQKNIKHEKIDKTLSNKNLQTKNTSKTDISNIIGKNIKIKEKNKSETPFIENTIENDVSSESVSHYKVSKKRRSQLNDKTVTGNEPENTQTNSAESFVPELTVPITNNNASNDSNHIEVEISIESSETCGVCRKVVAEDQWIDHISKDHNYIAWRHGEPALPLKDDAILRVHLQAISNKTGKLVCSKCGLVRKFAMPFLRHIKKCNGNTATDDLFGLDLNSTQEQDDDDIPLSRRKSSRLICGVCSVAVYTDDWFQHIKTQHKYLAWKHGEEPINLNSEDEVKKHLSDVLKQYGLECNKCGAVCDTVTMYLSHGQTCALECTDDVYECGVCLKSGDGDSWEDHAMNCHYNIAWKVGETPLDLKNDNLIDKCLRDYRLRKHSLKCNNCGIVRASTRGFYAHIVTCGKTEVEIDKFREVCEICDTKYLSIYKRQHMTSHKDQIPPNPMKRGRKPKARLDEEEFNPESSSDEDVKGPPRKRAKIKKSLDNATDTKLDFLQLFIPCDDWEQKIFKCGVCKMDVEATEWLNHAHKLHGYLAWIDGETPLDVEDGSAVRAHLSRVARALGSLVCARCGEPRKHVYAYHQHVRACNASGYNPEIVVPEDLEADSYECGVCKKRGPLKEFKEHAMKEHYNIAWMAGEHPINLRNFYAVEKYLKEYKKSFKLLCRICKVFRCSTYGFYAHILQCGKTDEELKAVHDVCDICNNKYLCIYKNQHVAMHRDQEHRRDRRRLQDEENARNELERKTSDAHPSGKRRAAEKAKKVIENYSSKADGKPVCSSCDTIFDSSEEASHHRCHGNGNDSDVSIKLEAQSDESDYSDVDSNASVEDELKPKKRMRHGEGSTKITRMAHRPHNPQFHLVQGYRDFVAAHYTNDSLFNEWRNSEYSVVLKDEIPNYLPTVTESCQVSVEHGQWKTYKLFEGHKPTGTIFTGGTVQCMSWVPDGEGGHYLAVVAHRAADVPRYSPADLPRDAALLQIWNYGNFSKCPYLAMALALDYGVVWAMDWCPSGARDAPPVSDKDSGNTMAQKVPPSDKTPTISNDLSTEMSDTEDSSNDTKTSLRNLVVSNNCRDSHDANGLESKDAVDSTESSKFIGVPRLGLVALACSNGSAYIFAVPYPQEKTEIENVIYKPKPCAELRFSTSSKRRMYQATSIHWSQQKGHSIVIVGYSDGTTALYDLNTESPLLKDTENGVAIFYPFQDKLSENSVITGAVVTPTLDVSRWAGAVCTASLSGCSLRAAVLAAPSVRSQVPASGAALAPLWPSLNVYGDMPFTSNSSTEVEWWGGGRRLGAAGAGAACARCGHAAAACAPAVRLLRTHPVHLDIKKQIIATLLMVPLGNKGKRKKVNDDLSVVVEPLTYGDAVAKYGLQFSYVAKKDQALIQKVCSENENGPERYPLSEVVAAAFCPSQRHHDRLACATYAGLVFIVHTKKYEMKTKSS